MKTRILFTLLILLLSISVSGQEDIKTTVSYDKTNLILKIDIKNCSNQVIIVRNQSRFSQTSGSFIELALQNKNGRMNYFAIPLADEPANYLWEDFTEMNPSETRTCVFKSSLKFYMVNEDVVVRDLISAHIAIAYFVKDTAGNLRPKSYSKAQNF